MSANLEKTLNNDEPFGYRSPNLPIAPTSAANTINRGSGWGAGCTGMISQSLSLREHDEQLNSLRKENFNLKLRIYFLEKRIPSVTDDMQLLIKQNIDLKVEIEALRAELIDKQALLCEAATAIKLMEQSLTNLQNENLATIEELNEKNEFLEMEIQTIDKFSGNSISHIHDHSSMNGLLYSPNRLPGGIEDYITQNEKKNDELMIEILDNKKLLTERNDLIKELEKKCEFLEYQISEMKEIISKNSESQNCEMNMRSNINNLRIRMKTLEMDFKKVKDKKSNTVENNSKLKELLTSVRNIMYETNHLKISY